MSDLEIDVQEVLEDCGVDYKETYGTSGAQYNIKDCPFCGDSRHKVFMNAESGVGNCFHGGCDKKTFNLYQFVKEQAGLSNYRDYLDFVGKDSVSLTKLQNTARYKGSDFSADLILPHRSPLQHDFRMQEMSDKRGISLSTLEEFGLYYTADGYFEYRLNGEDKYQSYEGRMIIPIHDINGELASFQGRDVCDRSEKKYLFPPGFASTGSLLYNAHKSIGKKTAVVCEGVFDVIGVYEALKSRNSHHNIAVLGSFGMKLSDRKNDDQITRFLNLKRNGLTDIIILWDGEHKAVCSAVDAGLILKKYGFNVRIAFAVPEQDPGDMCNTDIIESILNARKLNRIASIAIKNDAKIIYEGGS